MTTEEGEVAENERRGEEPADENLDDQAGAAAAAEAADDATPAKDRTSKKGTERVGLFGRVGRFFREVSSELRKVIWPTRNELVTYTTVVIVFVTIMTALVSGLDLGFAKGIFWVFGNKK